MKAKSELIEKLTEYIQNNLSATADYDGGHLVEWRGEDDYDYIHSTLSLEEKIASDIIEFLEQVNKD